MGQRFLPSFVLDLQDKSNQERSLQAIRTRFLLILAVWTFIVVTYILWEMSYNLNAVHIVCGVTLLINAIAYSMTRRWELPLAIIITSTFADMLAITILIYFTGGLNSMFFPLYLIQILGVSLLLNLYFSAIMVVWAVALVATMKALESAGIIASSATFIPTTYSDITDVVIWLVFQAITFCLVAFLGGNLSSKLKSNQMELKRKLDIEKTYEALRKANESKSRLLTNVSHNLRTPLTSIIGFSELLVGRELCTSEGEQYADIICREAQSLAHLLSDSFYLTELQEERPPWKAAATNISDIINRTIEHFRDDAEHKSLTLKFEESIPMMTVYGDASSLRETMFRLVDNAIKFTPRGSVTIKAVRNGEHALISIADTGIGIPDNVHDIVFEPLGEIYKTEHKAVPQRTGFGLAICRAIIEHHDGKIWFESEPDHGTTFYLTLPLNQP